MIYTKRIFLKYIFGACIGCFIALQGHATVRNGADQLEKLLPLLEGKRVSLVVNHTSLCGKTHLLDTLGMKVLNVLNIVILLTICHFAFGDCRETSLLRGTK